MLLIIICSFFSFLGGFLAEILVNRSINLNIEKTIKDLDNRLNKFGY